MLFADSNLQTRQGLTRGQELFFREYERTGTKEIAMGNIGVRWISIAIAHSPTPYAGGLQHVPLVADDPASLLIPATDVDVVAVFTCLRPRGQRGCPIRRHVSILSSRWRDGQLVYGGVPGAIRREYDASAAPRHVLRAFSQDEREGRLESPASGVFHVCDSELWRDLCVEMRNGDILIAYRIPQDCVGALTMSVAEAARVRTGQLLAELSSPVVFGAGQMVSKNRQRVCGTGDLLSAHREELTMAVMTMVARQNDLALGSLGLLGASKLPKLLVAVTDRQLVSAGLLSDGLQNLCVVEDLLSAISAHGDYYVQARHGGILRFPWPVVEGQSHLREVTIGDSRQYVPSSAIPLPGLVNAEVYPGQPIAHACERTTLCSIKELEDLVGHLNARELLADFVRQSAIRYRDPCRGETALLNIQYLGRKARSELALQDLVLDLREMELVEGIALANPINRAEMDSRCVALTSDLLVDFTTSFELSEATREAAAPGEGLAKSEHLPI